MGSKIVVRQVDHWSPVLAGRTPSLDKRVTTAARALVLGALVSTNCTEALQPAAGGAAPGSVEQLCSRTRERTRTTPRTSVYVV